jgi:hypothetical protein
MHELTSSDEEVAQSSHPLGLATSEVPEELGNDTDLNERFERRRRQRALKRHRDEGALKRIYTTGNLANIIYFLFHGIWLYGRNSKHYIVECIYVFASALPKQFFNKDANTFYIIINSASALSKVYLNFFYFSIL